MLKYIIHYKEFSKYCIILPKRKVMGNLISKWYKMRRLTSIDKSKSYPNNNKIMRHVRVLSLLSR